MLGTSLRARLATTAGAPAGQRGPRAAPEGEDDMRPHLSAEELGFLLGRLPLESPRGAVWREPEALASRAAPPTTPAKPRPAWPPAAPGRCKPLGDEG